MTPPSPRDIYRHGQAIQIIMDMERALQRRHDVLSCMTADPATKKEVMQLVRDIEDIWLDQMLPKLEKLKGHVRAVLPGEQPPA